ncbi:hypothetical protein RRU01S_04_01570 [Agrobacterium rubi TR3 = NBRC 13261]|uniref:Uncharacterized protein n=1 Tax=Agrobacterium rubi TR3 = NBRC 13261 TaxID=1368415 RepID=A0A081CRN9_9HYPH|nr:hypothetical protein [Agrobacterium rubi]MBP1876856.1 hypothetical protein [Agrobacterium rubi]MCL6651049.1 hypothetical protein [Agrobacterium rubi]GAK69335.1 hypothetical protein RRU01S_04_01570 [Agrobacterium rubi TR3 = NBRC 13261]
MADIFQAEIRTIADIREKIPTDRLDAFLLDLKAWVLMEGFDIGDAFAGLLHAVSDSMGQSVAIQRSGFNDVLHWVDDGQVGVSEIVATCGEKELIELNIRRNSEEGSE